jgi:hypothetical protein
MLLISNSNPFHVYGDLGGPVQGNSKAEVELNMDRQYFKAFEAPRRGEITRKACEALGSRSSLGNSCDSLFPAFSILYQE